MNIFVLDKDPKKAAEYHCDKHVVKMILETAQILSTVLRLKGVEDLRLYRKTHHNHPCTLWAMKSKGNFLWLSKLGLNLCEQYNIRYKKTHKSKSVILRSIAKINIVSFEESELTNFCMAMPEEFKSKDVVESYREYYRKGKRDILTWKTKKPSWV